jgi:preprotein translocase subunit SecE
MAKKVKEVKQRSKLMEVLTREYKVENLLLSILAMAGTIVSMLIIMKVLTIDENFPVLGKHPAGLVFAWILFGVSIIGFIILFYPFVSPSIPELRKISWPAPKKFLFILIRVFTFIIVITLILFVFDFVAHALRNLLESWSAK